MFHLSSLICKQNKYYDFFFFFSILCLLASDACVSPSLADLPTMEKPRSHSSSQAQWKPSDTLHYFMLVPIKPDTICCQEHSDTLQKGNPTLLHPLPRGVSLFLDVYYVITRRSVLSDGCPKVECPKFTLPDNACMASFSQKVSNH